MIVGRSALAILGVAVLAAVWAIQGAPSKAAERAVEGYVLSLSWSPTYCAREGAERNDTQCSAKPMPRGRPYAFIVHGLWPDHGPDDPEFCDSRFGRRPPQAVIDGIFDLMPSEGLIVHQWQKHGSCTGLSPAAYFDRVRAARARIVVPERFDRIEAPVRITASDVAAAFRAANPGLTPQALRVTCDGGDIEEVRICLGADLAPQPCEGRVRHRCPLTPATLPAFRGR